MLISMNTVLYHKEKERLGAVIHGFSLTDTHAPLVPWYISSGMPRALLHTHTHTHTNHTRTHTLFYFHGTHTCTSTSMVLLPT